MRSLLSTGVALLACLALGCDHDHDGAAAPAENAPVESQEEAATGNATARTPSDAVKAMAAAMRRGDSAAFEAMVHTGGDPQAEAFKALMVGLVDLHGASQEAFGQMLPHAYLTLPTQEQLDAMTFEDSGDEAVGTVAGAPPTRLVRVDGRWKMDFRNATQTGGEAAPEVYTQLGENARRLAGEIRQGRYATMQEADDELVRRSRQIVGVPPTTNPTTGPVTEPASREQ